MEQPPVCFKLLTVQFYPGNNQTVLFAWQTPFIYSAVK